MLLLIINTLTRWQPKISKPIGYCKPLVKEKVSNPYLWNVAAGYVSMFRNEATTAKDFLKKADAVAKNEKTKSTSTHYRCDE